MGQREVLFDRPQTFVRAWALLTGGSTNQTFKLLVGLILTDGCRRKEALGSLESLVVGIDPEDVPKQKDVWPDSKQRVKQKVM
jgi:hypothetical protein